MCCSHHNSKVNNMVLLTGLSALLLCPACGEMVSDARSLRADDGATQRGLLATQNPSNMQGFVDWLGDEQPEAHLLDLHAQAATADPVQAWLLRETRCGH
jgi:hypothetical protein